MFLLHGVECRGEVAEMLGRPQHPQRVTRRRGVDDDGGIAVRLSQLADVHPGHQLVDTR